MLPDAAESGTMGAADAGSKAARVACVCHGSEASGRQPLLGASKHRLTSRRALKGRKSSLTPPPRGQLRGRPSWPPVFNLLSFSLFLCIIVSFAVSFSFGLFRVSFVGRLARFLSASVHFQNPLTP